MGLNHRGEGRGFGWVCLWDLRDSMVLFLTSLTLKLFRTTFLCN